MRGQSSMIDGRSSLTGTANSGARLRRAIPGSYMLRYRSRSKQAQRQVGDGLMSRSFELHSVSRSPILSRNSKPSWMVVPHSPSTASDQGAYQLRPTSTASATRGVTHERCVRHVLIHSHIARTHYSARRLVSLKARGIADVDPLVKYKASSYVSDKTQTIHLPSSSISVSRTS